MHHQLQTLIADNQVGFEDLIEAYAQLCINGVRDITEDVISDEGIAGLVEKGAKLTVDEFINRTADYGTTTVPGMLGDIVDDTIEKKEKESWLEFVIRAAIITRINETKAFRIKFS